MPTYTTNPIKITDPSFSVATAIFGDLGFLGTQTISGTKRAQIIPFALLGLATTTTVLQKASNLSDLADAIAARGNLGAKNLWYVTGTAAPGNTIGIVNDFAFNDNGVLYEKTAATTWTSRIDFVTQAELTAANYLTTTAANALYAPIGENAGPGLRYTYNTSTTFPAATGQVLLSAATFAATTSISVHTSDRNSRDFASILDLGVQGARLQLTFDGAEETYAWFNITAIATSGSTRTYTVTHIQSNGTPANGEMLLQIVTVGGGSAASGIRLDRTFSTTTTAGPASGTLRLSNGNPQTTPTIVRINNTRTVGSSSVDQSAVLDKIAVGNIIQVAHATTGLYATYKVTAVSTSAVSATTAYNFSCDYLFGTAGTTSWANNDTVIFHWLPDNGAAGLTVKTVDNSVTGTASQLVLPNGTLAIASGVATYTPAASGGGGITWTEYTGSSQNIPTKSGAIANRATAIEFIFPAGAKGDPISIASSGAGGILSCTGQTFKAPDGTTNTGLRSLTTHPAASTDLLCLDPGLWLVRNNMNGFELFASGANPMAGFFTSFWQLGEATGNRLDSIGSNNLSPFNTVGYDATFGGATLAGTADAVNQQPTLEVASNSSFDLGPDVSCYVCCMVSLSSLTGSPFILSKYNAGQPDGQFYLYISSNKFAFDATDSTTNTIATAIAAGTITANQTYIVQAWYDHSDRKAKIKVDNASVVESAQQAAGFAVRTETDEFRIGTIYSNRRYGFAGKIKKVGFARNAPTTQQQTLIYNGGAGYTP